jgi:tetratricopeptide (TPR) repeat protein
VATIAEALMVAQQRQQLGDSNQAESIYRQILQVDPANVEALFLLGTLCHQLQKRQEAAFRLEQAVLLRPQEAAIHNALGLVLQDLGQLPQAMERYQQALRLQPQFIPPRCNIGKILHTQGRLVEAESCFRDALSLAPDNADVHYNLGGVLQAQGKIEAAAACYRTAIRLQPNMAAAHNNLGDVLVKQGRDEEALVCFHEALRLQPDWPELHYNLGIILQRQNKLTEAMAAYETAIRLRPTFAMPYNCLGFVLAEEGQRGKALDYFRQALRLQPNFADAHNNLGTMLLEEGEQDKAVYHFKEALRLNPSCIPAMLSLAIHGLMPFNPGDIERLKTLLANPRTALVDRSQLHFALGNIRNRAGAFDEAFSHFLQGGALRRRAFELSGAGFNADEHTRWTDRMIATCDEAFFHRVAGFGVDSEVPIFICGMPRSGTSLVEQIIASHPDVFGAGELQDVGILADGLQDRLASVESYPACLGQLDRPTTQAMADAYLRQIVKLGGPVPRVTDKMPGNCLHLGLIYAMFPRARIIHCRRDPLDVCVSCFVQYFRGLHYTWDLVDLGRFYRDYERLMVHWRKVLPVPMLEVVHEELVESPEPHIRKMLDFCGLNFDERCLNFHENKRAVRTVSLLQVRKPIFKSSVGRWRRYQKHLGPLMAALAGDEAKESLQIAD